MVGWVFISVTLLIQFKVFWKQSTYIHATLCQNGNFQKKFIFFIFLILPMFQESWKKKGNMAIAYSLFFKLNNSIGVYIFEILPL